MTLDYLFWGYLAGFLLIALYVVRLASRLGSLERRLGRLSAEERPDDAASR